MEKVRIGVIGAGRGTSMIRYAKEADNAQLVAICDKSVELLEKQKKNCGEEDIAYYTDYDEFLKHDMDAVILANYANEHAPFAIKAMRAGKHVFSEVLPVQTMKEAVELIEAVEETGKIYAYGENYCYMSAPYEMRRLYREGKIGEFEYAEGEYIHNCEPIWHLITYGEENHWRNNMFSTFYCTHSLGPIIHITGLRPVSVIGFEGTKVERGLRSGSKAGAFAIEMVTLENGGIIKSIHGGLYKNSIWYTVYGSKGRMESAREDAKLGDVNMLYVNADEYSGEYGEEHLDAYKPVREHDDLAASYGHGNSDFYTMYNFVRKIQGYEDADTIDVYEALDMFLPGIFAYRSILNGGASMEIPNLRDPEVREKYRNDTMCTDPKVAGDMLLPTSVLGTLPIPAEVYKKMEDLWNQSKDE
ncbi:MAG: Gfo/Idh/MocA family oxidoreductase [Ruminococcaceae bacterium]|nr:Gfo/Idh/MocA family oxidoreductase [Oscillospiraceae bacterium]